MKICPNLFCNSLVLTGPTGSGKSELALELAGKLNAEIVSMDSMTLYRGMDIGTAKPSAQDQAKVPHHLLDVLDPWQSASVAWWLEEAGRCCQDILSRGKIPLFVGGTPLYIKAMCFGLFDGPGSDVDIRQRLEQEALEKGREHLHGRLAAVDPQSALRLHVNDVRRIVRALEVWELTGKPLSSWQGQWQESSAQQIPECFWLDLPRTELYERINRRVERMFAEGLVEEVESLRNLPNLVSKEAGQALGYKEVFAYLDGKITLAQTIDQVQTRTRNFAKRQVTWFRHLPGCQPVQAEMLWTLWRRLMK